MRKYNEKGDYRKQRIDHGKKSNENKQSLMTCPRGMKIFHLNGIAIFME